MNVSRPTRLPEPHSGARREPAGRLAAAVAAASIALVLGGVLLLVLNQQSLLDGFQPHLITFGTTLPIIGWLIVKRLPGNRFGWVLLAGSLTWAISLFASEYAWFGIITNPGALPGSALAAWIGAWIWLPGTALLMTVLPLLYPDGRLPSARWSWVVIVVLAGATLATVTQAIGLWPQDDGASILAGNNNGSSMPGAIGFLNGVGQTTTFIAPLVATVALIRRTHRASGVELLQMRWFAYAVAVTAVTIIVDEWISLIGGTFKPSVVGILVIPASLWIAIFRYRLYEIDRIISRTISWTITTGVIVVVFAGIVVGLQGVLAQVTDGNTLSVAASTLVAFAISQPVRRRAQRAVDRRFNRSRYDAERLVDAFGERLRYHVDLTGLGSALAATADEAVRPTGVGVWIRSRGAP